MRNAVLDDISKEISKTRAELITELGLLVKNNESLENHSELSRACRIELANEGLLDDFYKADPKKLIEILERIETDNKEIEETEKPPKSKALSKEDLEILLAEYEKHREEEDAEKIALKILQNNPSLQKFDYKAILGAIETKIKVEAEYKAKGENAEVADKLSDETLIKEVELWQKSEDVVIDRETGSETKTNVVPNLELPKKEPEEILIRPEFREKQKESKSEVMAIINRLEEENNGAIARGEVEVVAAKIMEMAELKLTPEETEEKIVVEIKELGIKNPEFINTVQEVTADITAVKVVEEQVDFVSERIHKEIIEMVSVNIDEKKDEKIREIIETKVRGVFLEPTVRLGDYEVVTEKEGLVTTKSTGNNITQEIENILGVSFDENNKKQISRTIKTNDEILAKILILKGEDVDDYRGQKLEKEVFTRITENGETIKNATDMAKFVRELSFPKNGESITKIEIEAAEIMEANGYSGNENQATQKAVIIRRLISGPENIQETVNKILKIGNKLDGVEGFERWKNVAQELNKEKGSIKTLEFVQKLSKFQERFNGPGSKVIGQLGRVLNIPTWQEFGVKMATRFGGKTVGAMATHIAHFSQFGLGQGIRSIAGQFFTNGMLVPIKAGGNALIQGLIKKSGIKALAGAIGLGTGPLGWAAAAALFAVDLVVGVGKKLFSGIKNKLDGIGKALNLNFGVSKFLKQNLGGFVGGIVDTGLKVGGGIIMIMLAIPTFMAAISLPILLIVAPIVALPLYNHFQTATTQASSLVAPKGMDLTSTTVVGPRTTTTPGPPIVGECNMSSKLTKYTQYDWGSNTSIIYQAGCGPTSVAMMLHRRIGATPISILNTPPYSNPGRATYIGTYFDDARVILANNLASGAVTMGGCSEESIKRSICDGHKVVMINAEFNGYTQTTGHYFLAVAVENGKIRSMDPAYPSLYPFNPPGGDKNLYGYITRTGITGGCIFVDESAL